MTEDQRTSFYFPRWNKLAVAFDWRIEDGRLVADLEEQSRAAGRFAPYARDLFREVLSQGRAIALAARRAVVPDDLRYACNWIASNGRVTSSQRLTNREIDHFDRLHAVLLSPFDDLNVTIPWLNPQEDTRKRKIRYLRTLADEGRLVAIARNAWGIDDIDALSECQVDGLIAEVKAHAWKRYGTAANKQQRREVTKEAMLL